MGCVELNVRRREQVEDMSGIDDDYMGWKIASEQLRSCTGISAIITAVSDHQCGEIMLLYQMHISTILDCSRPHRALVALTQP